VIHCLQSRRRTESTFEKLRFEHWSFVRQSPPTSTDFRPVLRYFSAVLMPRVADVLALVDRTSAIVYRGIIGECPVERDVGERTVAGLPGDDGELSLAAGDGTTRDSGLAACNLPRFPLGG
jgi:hypothetical protein